MSDVYPGQPRPFDQWAHASYAVSTNNILVAAPAAGLSIYVQTLEADNTGLAAGVVSIAGFKVSAGGPFFAIIPMVGGTQIGSTIPFPSGLKLGSGLPLLVDVFTTACNVSVTYTIGPAL